MEPPVGQAPGPRGVPVPVHELFALFQAGLEGGHRVRVVLAGGAVEVPPGHLHRVQPQLFRDQVEGYGDAVPVVGDELGAGVHIADIRVHHLEALGDILAAEGVVAAPVPVGDGAHGAGAGGAVVHQGVVLHRGDDPVLRDAQAHVHVPLVAVQVEGLLAGVAAADGPSAHAFRKKGGDLLAHAQAPVAVFAALEQALLHHLVGGFVVHGHDAFPAVGRAFDVDLLARPLVHAVPPVGHAGRGIGDGGDAGGDVHVVFQDKVRLFHALVQVALHLDVPGDVGLPGRVGGVVLGHEDVALRRGHAAGAVVRSFLRDEFGAPDQGMVRLRALEDIGDEGQDLPFHLQGLQGLLTEGLALGDDDTAHLLALIVGLLRQIEIPVPAVDGVRAQLVEYGVVPFHHVQHAGDGQGRAFVDAEHLRVGVGAAHDLGEEHARHSKVRAVFRHAGGHGVGSEAGQVGFAHDAEGFPQAVSAGGVRHLADLLSPCRSPPPGWPGCGGDRCRRCRCCR